MTTVKEELEKLERWPPVKQWGIGEWGSAASILGVGLWGLDQMLKIVFNFSFSRSAKREIKQLRGNSPNRRKARVIK